MTHLGFILIVLILSWNVFGQVRGTNQTVFENAVIAARNGDHLNALSGFKKALMQAKIDGASDDFLSQIHFNIGVCLFQLERPNEAIAEYRESIRLNARYERAYYSLGMAALQTGDLAQSEKAFLESVRLNANNGEAWFDLAFVYIAKKDNQSARKAFENALKFNTLDSAISHNNIGVLAAIGGEIDVAEKEFVSALTAAKGNLPAAKANLEICKAMRERSNRPTTKLLIAGR